MGGGLKTLVLTRCLRCLHALQACATRLRLSAGTLSRVMPDTTFKAVRFEDSLCVDVCRGDCFRKTVPWY